MKRFRDQLPAVIRPDIIPTQDGMVITELDSVPGGIGMTACLSALYAVLFGASVLVLIGVIYWIAIDALRQQLVDESIIDGKGRR